MRKVLFKKWIPAEFEKGHCTMPYLIEGTNCMSDFIYPGIFHQWGIEYEEFETGPGNHSVAIIEEADGTINTVVPGNVKFDDKPKGNSDIDIDNTPILTIRQYYAGLAMQGILQNTHVLSHIYNNQIDAAAKASVICADSLIKALNEDSDNPNK